MFNIFKPKKLYKDHEAKPAPMPHEVHKPKLPPMPLVQPPKINLIAQESEYRPCWVRGRKALFHRWANIARPVLPRDAEPDQKTRFFQYRITQGLVEYEDGTMDRVWPQDIRFADRNRFKDYAWDDDPAYTTRRADYDNN